VDVLNKGVFNEKNTAKKVDIKMVALYNYMAYVVVEIKTILPTGLAG
jgi:hypothetical protein